MLEKSVNSNGNRQRIENNSMNKQPSQSKKIEKCPQYQCSLVRQRLYPMRYCAVLRTSPQDPVCSLLDLLYIFEKNLY